MWWIISISVLVVLLTYLVFIPMVIHIDTAQNIYFLQLKGLAKANVLTDKMEIIKIKLKVLFFNFYFYPLKKSKPLAKEKNIKPDKKSKKNIRFKKILKLIKTFKIKKFRIDIDTGNYITNSKLYPLFTLLNYKYGGFHVNFQDRNTFLLSLENRPIRIIKTIINK